MGKIRFDFLTCTRAQGLQFFFRSRNGQPIPNHGAIHFQMILERVDMASEPKGLILIQSRRGQTAGPSRQIEGIPVPLKDPRGRGAPFHQRIPLPVGGQMNSVPTYFFLWPGIHTRAQRPSDQLGSQANAEDRFPCIDGFADVTKFPFQKGITIVFINSHGTAHNQEPRKGLDRRKGMSLGGINILVGNSQLIECRSYRSHAFMIHMAKNNHG